MTGAGASRPFGVSDTALPLMDDRANHLLTSRDGTSALEVADAWS